MFFASLVTFSLLKTYISEQKIPSWHLLKLSSCFNTHPITLVHYFSKYWGDGCMGSPPPQILGGPSPSLPLSLRPCKLYKSRGQNRWPNDASSRSFLSLSLLSQ